MVNILFLGDPWEDRRYIISRKYRETLRLIVRLRMPALSVAFSLIQVSLLSVTEVVLYGTTWFHSFAIICILNSIQLTLVVVSTVVTMFVPSSTSHVWLICDIYMFLFFAANSLISLYTGAKILQNYKDKSENKFRKVVSSSSSWYRNQYGNVNSTNDAVFINDTNRVTINVETRDNNGVIGSITESETGSDGHNTAFVIAERNEMQRQRTNMTSVSSDGFSSFRDEDIPFPIRAEENQMKRPSLYPIYVDNEKNKTIVQKRRIGSLPYQTRSSKFCDKSIRKVSALMMVVAVFGIVMCCTIMMALYTADIVTDEQIGPVHWYTLRTVRRISEIGVTGTMAYMIRRPYHCFCCCQ